MFCLFLISQFLVAVLTQYPQKLSEMVSRKLKMTGKP